MERSSTDGLIEGGYIKLAASVFKLAIYDITVYNRTKRRGLAPTTEAWKNYAGAVKFFKSKRCIELCQLCGLDYKRLIDKAEKVTGEKLLCN